MAYLQGLDGLGRGMMQGMELARRHRFQDEDQQRQQRMDERQEQLHGLQTRQMEGSIDFNEQYRPVQLEQAQVGLESARSQMAFNEQRQPMQLEQDRLGLATGQHQLGRAQQEAAMQDWQQGARVAMMAAEQGDVTAINAWLANNPMGEQGMFDVAEDGSIRLLFSPDPNSDEMMERPVDPRELPSLIRTMAGMEQPERDKGMNINGHLVNPYTGEEMGDFRTDKQRGEGVSGQGSGVSGVDRQRYFDQARKSINDVLRTHVGEQFMGDPEARDIQALAQGATYQVLDDLIRSGNIGNASPEVLGNAAISLAFSGEYPGLRMSEAEGMAKAELSKDRGRFSGAPSQEKVQALAKQIQQEAAQTYQNDIAGMVMAQQPAMGGQQQQGMMPQTGLQTPQAPQAAAPQQQAPQAQGGLPPMIARHPEGSQAPQQPQPPRAESLQDFMPGGLLNRQNINDTAGARFGRGLRESFDNTMGMVGRDIRGENNFSILGTANPNAQGSAANYVVRGLDTAARGADAVGRNIEGFVSSIASPGVSSDQIPPAIASIETSMQSGQKPSREDVLQAVQFATQHPDAISAEGLNFLSYLAEQEGL